MLHFSASVVSLTQKHELVSNTLYSVIHGYVLGHSSGTYHTDLGETNRHKQSITDLIHRKTTQKRK